MANPDRDIDFIVDGDDIVVRKPSISVFFSYCIGTSGPSALEKTMGGWVFELSAPTLEGFSRRDIARAVCSKYQWIYDEEEKAVGDPGPISAFMMNRAPSNGPFCISMHRLGDLVLHTLTYHPDLRIWTLGIDS